MENGKREDKAFDSISPDIHSDIYEMNKHLDKDSKFLALDPERDFRNTRVLIKEIDDVTLLIKIMSLKLSEISALNSRRTGYLMFKYGQSNLEIDLYGSIKKKKLFKDIKKCVSIRGDIKFNLDEITGRGYDDFRVFSSPEQRDISKETKEILGCKSGSTVAFMYIIYAANSTFGNLDKNEINELLKANHELDELDSEESEEERLLRLERYYKDSGLLRKIKEYIILYENMLSGFIKKSYIYFKKLERYNEKRKIEMPCVQKIIQRIENEGWN
jgi:hypothetical protein